MANEQLIEYIKKSLAAGAANEEIISLLTANGWGFADINNAFMDIQLAAVPKPPVPVVVQQPVALVSPVASESAQQVAFTAGPLMAKPQLMAQPKLVKADKVNSPYSIILSVGLLVFLFVLGNQLFDDISKFTDIAGRLMTEAVVITAFFLFVLLLDFMLKEGSGHRFKALVDPYFLLCGWLFLRTFWHVLNYLYYADAAFGIYVALGLIVVLFTGVIFYWQRHTISK
jgi:hypothetical protein